MVEIPSTITAESRGFQSSKGKIKEELKSLRLPGGGDLHAGA